METVIIGAGGHARDIASWTGMRLVPHHSQYDGSEPYVIGIHDPRVRFDVSQDLIAMGCPIAARPLVHRTAHVGPGIHLPHWVVIGPLTSLLADVALGQHVHIGAGCHLTRCYIGYHTTISPGAVICGDVEIGDRVLIGAGAVIKNMVTIGDDATIGAGAVVVGDVPNGATVKGVPAR